MCRLLKISLKISMMVGILVLAMGSQMEAPMARAGDDSRSERPDLDLSRHDHGELWDDDSHEILREHDRDDEKERDDHRDVYRDRERRHDREGNRDRDSMRERDHDREHGSVREMEKQDD